MSQEQDKILIEVEIDEKATEARVLALRKRLDELKGSAAALKKTFSEGGIGADAYAEAMEKLERETKAVSAELAQNRRTLELNDKALKSAGGSITQLRANLSNLKQQYADLSQEQRDNTEAGKAYLKQISETNQKLKELESAYGDNQRSVGDYRGAIRDALKENNSFLGQVLDIRDRLQGTVDTLKQAKDGLLQEAAAARVAAAGMDKGTLAAKGFGAAMKAIGIGLIIAALAGLVSFMTKTEEGAGKLASGMAAIEAAIDKVIKGLAPLGKLLVDTFTKPLETIQKLIDGTDEYRVHLDKVAGSALKAAQAASQYEAAVRNVEKAQRAGAIAAAEAAKQAEIALAIADNENISYEKRAELLRKAGAIQLNSLKEQIRQQKELTRLARERVLAELDPATAARLRKLSDDQLNRKLEQLRVDTKLRDAFRNSKLAEIQLEQDLFLKQLDIQKNLGDVERDRRDAAKEAAQKREEERKKALEVRAAEAAAALEIVKIQRGTDAELLKATEQYLNARFRLETDGLKKSSQQYKLLQLQRDSELYAARVAILQKHLEERQQMEADAARSQSEVLDLTRRNAQADLQIRLQGVREGSAAETRLRLEALEEQRQIELSNANLTRRERQAIEVKYNAERLKLEEELIRRISETNARDRVANANRRLTEAKAGSRGELQARLDLLREQRKAELDSVEQTEEQVAEIRARYRKAEKDLTDEYWKRRIGEIAKTVEQASMTLVTALDAQSQIALNNFDRQQEAALKSAGTNAEARAKIEEQFQKKREVLEKKAARQRQRIASIENVIQTARNVNAAMGALTTAGRIIGVALAIAQGIAQQAVIDSQKFAQGGFVSDRKGAYVRGRGTTTSDSINARLSDQESVINARSTRKHYNLLSAINEDGGGRRFPNARQIPLFNAGGIYSNRTLPTPVQTNSLSMLNDLPHRIAGAVVEGLRQAPAPVVSVTAFDRVRDGMKKGEVRRDL